jgi:hypothetical protein
VADSKATSAHDDDVVHGCDDPRDLLSVALGKGLLE